ITSDHPLLVDLCAVAQLFERTRTRVVFYITPIDHETGVQALGRRFWGRVHDNTTTLATRLVAHGGEVLDLSRELAAAEFAWRPSYPNERVTDVGREHVARRLAAALRERRTR